MFNGYETKELVEAHIEALERELEVQKQVGNDQAVKACAEQLELYRGLLGKKKPKAVETRRRTKPKPKPAAAKANDKAKG